MVNWEAVAAISQLVGTIGVIITLIYLAIQVRGNTKVVSAQSRHAISEFALRMAISRTEHADRAARIASGVDLTDGDREFRFWSHAQLMLHAETYFHHHALGLMPDSHWRPYERFWSQYVHTPGFSESWQNFRPAYSDDFARWMDALFADRSPELGEESTGVHP